MSPSVPKPPKSPKKARKPVKRKRTTPRRQVGKCPALLAWMRNISCVVLHGRVYDHQCEYINFLADPAHLPKTRRLGGDLDNVIPLCRYHHEEQHRMGVKSFAAKYDFDLAKLARAWTLQFFRETGVPRPQENG